MTEVDIPFNDWSKDKLESRKKTATTRTEAYGSSGDVFKVELKNGQTRYYMIWGIFHVPLQTVKNCFYRIEGCESEGEFLSVWEDIHPRKGYEPDWLVHLHIFSEIDREDFEKAKEREKENKILEGYA